MTKDYSYDDDMRVTLDDHDRAKNTPMSLSHADYPLDVVVDHTWPGTEAAGGGIQFDPDGAEQVATWLDDQTRGPLADVASRLAKGTAVSFGPATWREAVHLQEASSQVSAAVTKFTSELVSNLGLASGAIRTAHQNYSNADQAGQNDARAVDAKISNTSGTGSSAAAQRSGYKPGAL